LSQRFRVSDCAKRAVYRWREQRWCGFNSFEKSEKKLTAHKMLAFIERFAPPTKTQSVTVCKNNVCRYTVPSQKQAEILMDVRNLATAEHFVDVYVDTNDLELYKNNIWLHIRNGCRYTFKTIRCLENDAQYVCVAGDRTDLPAAVAFNRVLMINKVSRLRLTPDVWVDFVASDDGAGRLLYNCVVSVRGNATPNDLTLARESLRCVSAAYLAAQELLPEENFAKRKPAYWPHWEQPKELATTMSKEDVESAHAVFDSVLKEEFGNEAE
jgi:hypothetical protein